MPATVPRRRGMLVPRSGRDVVPSTHGRCAPSPPHSGAWPSPDPAIRASGRDRTIRWLTAALIATSILGIAVVPAFAADPSPSPVARTAHRPAPRRPGHPHPVAEAVVAHDRHHARQQREVLRPGLRPRRRHEPVRRPGPRAGRPDGGADPGRVLQGRDAVHDQPHPTDPRPRAQPVRRPVDRAARPLRPRRHVGLHGDRRRSSRPTPSSGPGARPRRSTEPPRRPGGSRCWRRTGRPSSTRPS